MEFHGLAPFIRNPRSRIQESTVRRPLSGIPWSGIQGIQVSAPFIQKPRSGIQESTVRRPSSGIPFPHVPGSPAMHNPRSMIHDLAPTAHESRSAPRSPICNLRCSINDPRITAQSPGTSEINAGSLSHAGIPKLTTVPPLVLPGTPEFTSDCRGAAGMPGIQPDLTPKSSSNSVFDPSTMQPLPNFPSTPGLCPLTPKSSRRRCTILDP